jgi:hypothetical protein
MPALDRANNGNHGMLRGKRYMKSCLIQLSPSFGRRVPRIHFCRSLKRLRRHAAGPAKRQRARMVLITDRHVWCLSPIDTYGVYRRDWGSLSIAETERMRSTLLSESRIRAAEATSQRGRRRQRGGLNTDPSLWYRGSYHSPSTTYDIIYDIVYIMTSHTSMIAHTISYIYIYICIDNIYEILCEWISCIIIYELWYHNFNCYIMVYILSIIS